MSRDPRLALIKSTVDAGLSARSVAAEVLLMLPRPFADTYEQVFIRIYGSGGAAVQDADTVTAPARRTARLSSSSTETRGAAKSGGRKQGVSNKTVIRDGRALAAKEGADRKLRKIARELAQAMAGRDDVPTIVRRCTGPTCKRWADDTWAWCPWCRSATEDVEVTG